MKRNANIRRVVSASLAFLVSSSPIARAMEGDVKKEEGGGSTKLLRDHDYYKEELRKLEESTKRIHKEVDRILAEFRRNMEEYYNRTRGTGTTAIAAVKSKEKVVEEEFKKPIIIMDEKEKEFNEWMSFESNQNIIEDALYAKKLLGGVVTPEKRQIDMVTEFREFRGVRENIPTEAEFFLMFTRDLPYYTSQKEFDLLTEGYNEAKSELKNLLKVETPSPKQICEWMRQRNDLKIAKPELDKINEGVHQEWEMEPRIRFPRMNQILEGLRLKTMGIQNPSRMQINVGAYIEKGNNQNQVDQFVEKAEEKLKSFSRNYLLTPQKYPQDAKDDDELEVVMAVMKKLPEITKEELNRTYDLISSFVNQDNKYDGIDKIWDSNETKINEKLLLMKIKK